MSDPVLMSLSASAPRRWSGVITLSLLGALILYLAFAVPFGPAQIIMILGGVGILHTASLFHHSTQQVIELTKTELRIKDGPLLAKVSDVVKVERGAFAFKPSNGFLVSLKTPMQRRWAMGMYWCFSKRVGVGGVTGAGEGKAMSETLAMLISDEGLPDLQMK